MRAVELLLEAKPENLGDVLIKKLGQAYYKKSRTLPNAESTNPAEVEREYLSTGYSLADYLYKQIGPKFLIWVVKQYIQDPHFMHEDIPAWADTLGEYTQAVRANKTIERDINKFPNIDELRTELRKHAESSVGKVYDIIVPVLDQFVQAGQAEWLYKGTDYAIYHPSVWEASHEFYRVLNNKGIKTKLCVTYNVGYYQDYTKEGYFVLIITPDTGYISFINTTNKPITDTGQPSEFADMYNNHSYGLAQQLEMFPKLRPILVAHANRCPELNVVLLLDPTLAEKKVPGINKAIKQYGVKKVVAKKAWYDVDYLGTLFNHADIDEIEEIANDPNSDLNDIQRTYLHSLLKLDNDTIPNKNDMALVIGKTSNKDPLTGLSQFLIRIHKTFYTVPVGALFDEQVDNYDIYG